QREIELLTERFERAGPRDPLLALHESAEKNGLEVVARRFERDVGPGVRDHVVRKAPVVIEATLVFVFLDLGTGGLGSGEILDGLSDSLAVAFRNVYQNAVHIEDEQRLHRMTSSAESNSRGWSRVP